jgi:glycosyltransferase involved in cell wall biosynthesis
VRVLLITARSDFGGGPKHVNDLLNNISPEYDVYLACPEGIPFYNMWRKNPRIKEVFVIPFRKFSIPAFLGLGRFAKKNEVEVIHSHGRGAGIYSRLLKYILPETRIIHTVHGFYLQDYPPLKKYIAALIERILSFATEKVIAVSNGEKANMMKFNIWREDRINVIYNGIEEPNEIDNKEGLRKKLGLPADKFIIISVVRFNSLKNIEMTIDIAEKLKDMSSILFVIAGDGEEFSKIKRMKDSRGLENVLLPGFKENALEYIKASDVYISTSIREGLPISLIEACMLGVPILATDVTGNNEVVTDGENGYVFDLKDTETPVNKIAELSKDRNKIDILKNNARAIFEKKFTIEKMSRQVEDIYASK